MNQLTDRIEKLKKLSVKLDQSPFISANDVIPLLTDCHSEIERLERVAKAAETAMHQYIARETPPQKEIERLERQLEAAETALKSIEDDMRYKPVQFDWPVWATKWLASIVDYFAQSQKGSQK